MAYENMPAAVTRPTQDNYHALLFVGVCNRERYVLSLIRWTNLLHQMYGYPLANIRIIVGPYSNPAWATMVPGTDVTYNATMADLDAALAAYATGSGDPHALGADDNLFIFTFNHGGQDATGCYLCCNNYAANYYAGDFAARISAIHCRQVVLLAAQCHAGGFVDPFIGGLHAGTRGAVLAGCRDDQNTYEAVYDKLIASALNGRMVQNALDDNIDLGITGDGIGVYTVPGYHTDRVDWGVTGVMSMREVHNWVYDHYVNRIYPVAAYAAITEIPLYRQSPWTEAGGKPVHIRLGEPDLVMQDCAADTGVEPGTCSPSWNSPDVYPENSDQFPGVSNSEYVPAHHNRFFVRTTNRGTAPTDEVWRLLEVRYLGFTGGPVGPPRIDRAVETSGATTVSARLRPGRAHTQHNRIFIGGDFGHGCISAAAWTPIDVISHTIWSISPDNDQVMHNMNAAAVSGTFPADGGSTNANAGLLIRVIPILGDGRAEFTIKPWELRGNVPLRLEMDEKVIRPKAGQVHPVVVRLALTEKVKDGQKAELPVAILRNGEVVGGVTFAVTTATANLAVRVRDLDGRAIPKTEITLTQPQDPRRLTTVTDDRGVGRFGPLNPGFYFAETKGVLGGPKRVHVPAGKENLIDLTVRATTGTSPLRVRPERPVTR